MTFMAAVQVQYGCVHDAFSYMIHAYTSTVQNRIALLRHPEQGRQHTNKLTFEFYMTYGLDARIDAAASHLLAEWVAGALFYDFLVSSSFINTTILPPASGICCASNTK